MTTAGLQVSAVTKTYPTAAGPLQVLSEVDFHLAPGQSAAITGPSGSGKSTLLYILGALEPPSTGTVTLDGQNPHALTTRDLADFRNRQIGFVFQDHCLLPQLSVLENVLVPTLVAGDVTRRQDGRGRRPGARADAHRSGWPDVASGPPAGRAVWRRTSARGHRARARPASASGALRRADGEPRRRFGRVDHGAAPRPAPAAPDDPDRRHTQPDACRSDAGAVRTGPGRAPPEGGMTRRAPGPPEPVPLLAQQPRRRPRRGHGGGGPGRGVARGCLGARDAARSRARATGRDRCRGARARLLPGSAGR